MASNRNPTDDDDDSQRKRTEDNPFVSFRHFVDEEVSGLLNLSMKIMGIPESYTNKNVENEKDRRAYWDTEQRERCPPLVGAHSEGLDSNGRIDKVREEINKLDKMMEDSRLLALGEPSSPFEIHQRQRMLAEQRSEELLSKARHAQDNMAQSPHSQQETTGFSSPHGCYGPWKLGFGGCTKGRKGLEADEELEDWSNDRRHWSNSRWVHRRQRAEIDKDDEQEAPKVHRWHWSWSYPSRTCKETPQTIADGPQQHAEDWKHTNPGSTPPLIPVLFSGIGAVMGMVRYLKQDEYSPLQLESSLVDSEIAWREAYEDLIRADTGQPLLSESELEETAQTSKQVWIGQFFGRTILNSRAKQNTRSWPSIGDSPFSRDLETRIPPSRWLSDVEVEAETDEHDSYEYSHDHEDQHEDPPTPRPDGSSFDDYAEMDSTDGPGPETELEAYERFLTPTPFTPSENRQEPTTSRPSILSTLTTTERTTHPDGTITTKMVLKKRFADGREESSETIHTTQGLDRQMVHGVPSETGDWQRTKQTETPPTPDGQKKSRGWFWS